VMAFKGRNMIGSLFLVNIGVLNLRTGRRDIRYAMTMESFLRIASSTTALVRSMVRRTELFRWFGRYGASSRTVVH
jgi:hypothetical protein